MNKAIKRLGDELRAGLVLLVAFPILAVITPFFILWRLYERLRFGPPLGRTPQEVADDVKGILVRADVEHHWDNLDSTPIKEPRLEEIRRQALSVAEPLDDTGRATLGKLLAQIEALKET